MTSRAAALATTAVGAALIVGAAPVLLQNEEYLPLSPQEIGAPFPLKHIGAIGSDSAPMRTAAGPGGSTLTMTAERVSLEGQDTRQRPWHADLINVFGCAGAAQNFNDGYWITNVYSVEAGHWRRARGLLAGRRFPLYTRFTSSPNRRAVVPPERCATGARRPARFWTSS